MYFHSQPDMYFPAQPIGL